MKIRELLSDESKWTKGAWARTQTGVGVHPTHKDADQWCLVGAARKCYSNCVPAENHFSAIIGKLEFALETYYLIDWNDRATFEDVKKLVETLDV